MKPSDDADALVSETELHAWVDGQLPPERMAAVQAWLEAHADEAARVDAWQAQNLGLRELLRRQVLPPAPSAMTAPLSRRLRHLRWRTWGGQALAAGLLLALGVGVGRWWGPVQPTLGAQVLPAFVHEAQAAYAAYVPERRHPVEVAATEQAHLLQWLSHRLGAPLKAPDLQAQGYQLLGGRLLPGAGEGAPRAQFMYEDGRGTRLTLYVAVFAPGQAPSSGAFRQQRAGAQQLFYWVDERFGYALSGPLDAPAWPAVTDAVYRQLAGS